MKKIVTISNPANKTIDQALVELNAAIGHNLFYNCDVDFTSAVVPFIKTAHNTPVYFVIEYDSANSTFSLYDSVKDEYLLINRPSTLKNIKLAARQIFIRSMCENVDFDIESIEYEVTLTLENKSIDNKF